MIYILNPNKFPGNEIKSIPQTSFIKFHAVFEKKSFYGVSLKKDQRGIIYHSIGVNGARYDQFNIDSLFCEQGKSAEMINYHRQHDFYKR